MTPSQVESANILNLIRRYRLMVPRALSPALSQDLRVSESKRMLQRLVDEGLLGRSPLYRRSEYFFLAEKGARRLLDLSPAREVTPEEAVHGPLSEIAKVRAFAFLSYCCLGNARRERLILSDMQDRYPQLVRLGQPQNYYLDLSGSQAILGFLHVDVGGESRWDRIIYSFRNDIADHLRRVNFHPMIQEGRFEMAVVTALPQKAERIRTALGKMKMSMQMFIRVAVVPDLLHLIAPPPY